MTTTVPWRDRAFGLLYNVLGTGLLALCAIAPFEPRIPGNWVLSVTCAIAAFIFYLSAWTMNRPQASTLASTLNWAGIGIIAATSLIQLIPMPAVSAAIRWISAQDAAVENEALTASVLELAAMILDAFGTHTLQTYGLNAALGFGLILCGLRESRISQRREQNVSVALDEDWFRQNVDSIVTAKSEEIVKEGPVIQVHTDFGASESLGVLGRVLKFFRLN